MLQTPWGSLQRSPITRSWFKGDPTSKRKGGTAPLTQIPGPAPVYVHVTAHFCVFTHPVDEAGGIMFLGLSVCLCILASSSSLHFVVNYFVLHKERRQCR